MLNTKLKRFNMRTLLLHKRTLVNAYMYPVGLISFTLFIAWLRGDL